MSATNRIGRTWAALVAVALVGSCGGASATKSLPEPQRVTSVSIGFTTTCFTRADRSVWCFGSVNASGELGNGTRRFSYEPVRVANLSTATKVAVASGHACALLSDGTVWCWGKNKSMQLGVASISDSDVPVLVPGVEGAIDISTDTDSCALLKSGAVMCWGPKDTITDDGTGPRLINEMNEAIAVAANETGGCGITPRNAIVCWNNGGKVYGRALPATEFGTVSNLDVGTWHSCAVTTESIVRCWGSDSLHGRLGDGAPSEDSRKLERPPVKVVDVANAKAVKVAEGHSCAQTADDTLACWGSNKRGQIGNGSTESAKTPYVRKFPAAIVSFDVGTGSTCAALSTGRLYCWGEYRGAFGAAETASSVPTEIVVK